MTHLSPKKSLNKAWLKVKPVRSEVEKFKSHLIELLDTSARHPEQHEEFHKNLIRDFLNKTGFEPDFYINIHDRQDLVVHNGNKASTPVGVILEVKKPDNKTEMPRAGKLNTKALQELLLYFLRERMSRQNKEIRHLIVTNVTEWFIFDAQLFEKLFAANKTLVRQFEDFENGTLGGKSTDFFYREIAEAVIREKEEQLEYTHLNLNQYTRALKNSDKEDDRSLIPVLKLLSPQHLLKLRFANDSNSLDRKFYAELLHIIGLEETKEGGKKVIGRKKEADRNEASLLENAILKLESQDKISRLSTPSQFGGTYSEQLFQVGLELSITWINRILFLKLLEGQLISYHRGDKHFRFLHSEKITDYDDLEDLFFGVLALEPDLRSPENKEKFRNVPYLNSSLFEISDLEHQTLTIGNLRNDRELPLLPSTVLKDESGRKRSGKLNALQYLFEFLDAYDFSSEGAEEIQEDNKTLINASVLGLIFEKINGYKDGSFFTPGFITMYMCRETLRRAVVTRFNETMGWSCQSIAEVEDRLELEHRKQANDIVNSLKICDPAVGSGHFLVSALNELIVIKKELGILQDKNGRRIKEYDISVENDELQITDDEGNPFEYHYKNSESQRIQETLFHEKQTLIENCLFGVDINPNSVKICRLRLWIELLKNAYYKQAPSASGMGSGHDSLQLETLPNIDINIKCGNSLVSRFALDADLGQALRKSKWDMGMYRDAVSVYRNAADKKQKRSMQQLIEDIKSDFKTEISQNSREQRELNKFSNELYNKYMSQQLFDQKLTKAQKADRDKLEEKVKKLKIQIDEIKSNRIYENAFEWRFEFPEVLNDSGDFVGFDVIIGNPPYIRQEEFTELKPHLQSRFSTFAGTADLFTYFVELGVQNLREGGEFTFIIPNKWMRAGYGQKLREFLKQQQLHAILDFGDLPVFEEATTYPCILSFAKKEAKEQFTGVNVDTLDFPEGLAGYVKQNKLTITTADLADGGWNLTDSRVQNLLNKIKKQGIPLSEYVNGKIFYGIKTGLNEAFVIDRETRDRLVAEDARSEEIIRPFLAGRDIKRYQQPVSDKFLILFKNGDTKRWFGDLKEAEAWERVSEKYPAVCKHLEQYKSAAQKRYDQGHYWWELRACDYYEEFEKPKVMLPDISLRCEAILDKEMNFYCVNTAYIIPGLGLSDLAILNSKLVLF